MSLVHDHDNTVPRPALAMAGILVGATLAMTAAVQWGFAERAAVPAVERSESSIGAVEARTIVFRDRSDGAVEVVDAKSGQDIAVLVGEGDGGGFVRGVLRGLARDRRMRGVGSEPPFELTLWQDGAMSLKDSATGRSVELGSFGPDKRAAFARFLKAGGAA
jgi:putative photosynthetic complex assembly protein